MFGTYINCIFVLCGSLIGILLRNRLSKRFTDIIIQVLGLCVLSIGIKCAIQTSDLLCVIISIVLGTILGEALRIEDRLEQFGDFLKAKMSKDDTQNLFTEGFVSSSILFCVGAMSVLGSMEAGIHGDYSILLSKSVLDGITSITFAAAFGIGVAFSSVPLLLYQGSLTLLSTKVATILTPEMVNEMSAVGGLLIIAIALNILGITMVKLKVGNMLPAIFLPTLYLPCFSFLLNLFGAFF